MNLEKLAAVDPEINAAIGEELGRQRNKIELIASENFVSPAVMEAMGTVLTNKYAEGYPGHRYYGGCEYVDKVEILAIERAKKLFGAVPLLRLYRRNYKANAYLRRGNASPHEIRTGRNHRPSL